MPFKAWTGQRRLCRYHHDLRNLAELKVLHYLLLMTVATGCWPRQAIKLARHLHETLPCPTFVDRWQVPRYWFSNILWPWLCGIISIRKSSDLSISNISPNWPTLDRRYLPQQPSLSGLPMSKSRYRGPPFPLLTGIHLLLVQPTPVINHLYCEPISSLFSLTLSTVD
jgi:hypothetical protein